MPAHRDPGPPHKVLSKMLASCALRFKGEGRSGRKPLVVFFLHLQCGRGESLSNPHLREADHYKALPQSGESSRSRSRHGAGGKTATAGALGATLGLPGSQARKGLRPALRRPWSKGIPPLPWPPPLNPWAAQSIARMRGARVFPLHPTPPCAAARARPPAAST